MAEPDVDLVRAEMEHIAVLLESQGHVFTQTSAMAVFVLGIRTLVGYGIKPEALTSMVVQVARAAYSESAEIVQQSRRLVDPSGRPL